MQLRHCDEYIEEVLLRVKREYIVKTYGLTEWTDAVDFLEQLATKTGKLLRGAEPDTNAVAKLVLHDWQRGRLPYFVPPPGWVPKEPFAVAGASSVARAAPEASAGAGAAAAGSSEEGGAEVVATKKQSLKALRKIEQVHEFADEDTAAAA